MKNVDFYFDFGSTASYIAYKVLPRITEKAGALINYKPVLLGGVFKATGNASPITVPAKGAWVSADMTDYARRYEIPFKRNPYFPINTLALMRGAIGYQDDPVFPAYMEAVFNAIWIDEKDMNQPEVIGEILQVIGIDGSDFMARIGDDGVKEGLKVATQSAIDRGMFGAPMIYVGDKMFFGQDRLHLVAEALGVNIFDIAPKYIEIKP